MPVGVPVGPSEAEAGVTTIRRGAGSGAPPWVRGAGRAPLDAALGVLCRESGLVYTAVVGNGGAVLHAVCTVGDRPHNEARIGQLVKGLWVAATTLGGEVGEREPRALDLQGNRWSYVLHPLTASHQLFGIFPTEALVGVVRASVRAAVPGLAAELHSLESAP